MKRRILFGGRYACRSLLCAGFIATHFSSCGVWAEDNKPNAVAQPKTTKLYGQLNSFGSACVSSGVTPLSTQLPTTVEEVKKGSPAFYAGVGVGDKILAAGVKDNLFCLKIERNGKVYLAKMQAKLDPILKNSLPVLTFTPKSYERDVPTLNISPDSRLGDILKSYDIRLIVDHSGSMYRPVGNTSKLRWQWVKDELDRFCRNVQIECNATFELCLFNETVDINKNISAMKVRAILDDAVTTGNTDLPTALKASLTDNVKPLLIILVTDGLAVSSQENADILLAKFNRSPVLRRSKIVFLQAGYSEEGVRFVTSLKAAMARNGMNQGAALLLFEETSQNGILRSIEPYLRK